MLVRPVRSDSAAISPRVPLSSPCERNRRAAAARLFASYHLTGTAVTPAFVLMTIASLVVVMLGTALRARSPGGSDAGPRDDAGQVPQRAATHAGTLAGGRPQT